MMMNRLLIICVHELKHANGEEPAKAVSNQQLWFELVFLRLKNQS
jgi:hypothetical protein